MEASTFTTPAFMTSFAPQSLSSTPAYTTPEPATIKMEDLQKPQLPLTPPAEHQKAANNNAAGASQDDSSPPTSPSSPAPSSISPSSSSSATSSESKPVKKRKSWGQVLPEPKTNLPPRKRAKTEDEKEQRRIERVKRNRLAAHNSRERKRQEVEALQQDKKDLEDRVQQLEAALRIYQQHLPDLKIDSFNFQASTPMPAQQPATPASSSADNAADTINPRTASFTSMTPQTSPSLRSIDSPPYSESQPATPEAFPEATVAEHDETQHSAVSVVYQQSSVLDGKSLGVSSSDYFAHHVQSPAPYDAAALDDLFNFSSFDDLSGHLHNDQDKYPNTFFETQFPDDLVNLDLSNNLGGDLDLLAASGATSIVSDETGIADSI